MRKFFDDISKILLCDPGNRGLTRFIAQPDLAPVYGELLKCDRAMIITGFPIYIAQGHICCETDGPVGAADMAYAFTQCGIPTAVVTDEASFPQVRAAVDCRAPQARTYLLKKDDDAAARRMVDDLAPTHILPIERPGKAVDGHCHAARGTVLDGMLADMDALYAYARERGAVAIAIGDGGNELGTGIHRAAVSRLIPGGGAVAAVQAADYTLMAGVSNWWGWGIAALLSARLGRSLLPDDMQQMRLMRAVLEAGAVDGITKQSAMTVDNLSLEENLEVLRELRAAFGQYLLRRTHND